MDNKEQMEIAQKVLRCIEHVEQQLEQGVQIEGVGPGDIENLKFTVEMVLMG